MRHTLVLTLIILLAFILRFYQITDNPPSLNWDEVSHGYNAYSILKTGKDEWGIGFPWIFRAYGDYKLPAYIYITAASEAVFGLNEFAVRLPSALAGTLSVFFAFLLTKKLFKNDTLGLLVALFMAIEPWSIFISRIAVEANMASFLIILGTYFFFLGLDKRWWLLVSALSFGLSLHTYNSARIFTPLFLIFLTLLHRRQIIEHTKKRQVVIITASLVFLVFFIPMVRELTAVEGQARYHWVGLLDEGTNNRINEARSKSSLPNPIPRLIFNKLTYYTFGFLGNYVNYLSPDFLFFSGGSNYQFNIPKMGLIYPIQLPFVLLGLLILLKRRDAVSKTLLAWLIISPIPGSLTLDSPHTLRASVMLPLPQILTALGLWKVWQFADLRSIWLKGALIGSGFSVLLLYFFHFWSVYFTTYRTEYSWAWQQGYKETVGFLRQNYSLYDKIIMTKKYGEPHEFILFWWPWDPQKFRDDPELERYFRTDWYWVDKFDKFEFVNDWEVKDFKFQISNFKYLLVTSPGNSPDGWRLLKTINFLDGKPAFEILTNQK